jgi:hypothetical protein
MTDELRNARFVAVGSLALTVRGGRGGPVGERLSFRADQSMAHMAEVLGIPRCEIGGVEVDGEPWPLALPAPEGSLVRFLPVEEPLVLAGEPAFIVDVHLGALARDLRLLGFDMAWRNDWADGVIALLAAAEGRIVLSRDRGLLFQRAIMRGMFIRSTDPFVQLVEVVLRFGLAPRFKPLSRCSGCGSLLAPVPKAEVLHLLPPIVAERYEEFSRCPDCGKLFWKGDHWRSIGPLLRRLAKEVETQ